MNKSWSLDLLVKVVLMLIGTIWMRLRVWKD